MRAKKSPQVSASENRGPTAIENLLHLLLLSGFAVAQPLFDLLSREPGFFVARRSQPLDIVVLAVILMIAPSLILGAIETIIGLFSEPARRHVHLVFVGLLITLTALPPLNRIGDLPDIFALGGGLLAGLVGAIIYRRSSRVRSLGSLVSPVVVVFVIVFFLRPSIRTILYPRQVELRNVADPTLATPVVLVVFDGLPLVSLLDDSWQIDSARYPNFAELASTSTWFRNVTTVSDATMRAIPAILSGQYPEKGLLPVVQDYPGNLLIPSIQIHCAY